MVSAGNFIDQQVFLKHLTNGNRDVGCGLVKLSASHFKFTFRLVCLLAEQSDCS
ncbi:hypothetical protein QBC45DRAFT_412434 [Copromyces sp. CBS 386.78]|nr:hypothetical protein QBC45DRAFT_412434 [Copromyces sp. CBS 386.78]